jgi:hypothetical protein
MVDGHFEEGLIKAIAKRIWCGFDLATERTADQLRKQRAELSTLKPYEVRPLQAQEWGIANFERKVKECRFRGESEVFPHAKQK